MIDMAWLIPILDVSKRTDLTYTNSCWLWWCWQENRLDESSLKIMSSVMLSKITLICRIEKKRQWNSCVCWCSHQDTYEYMRWCDRLTDEDGSLFDWLKMIFSMNRMFHHWIDWKMISQWTGCFMLDEWCFQWTESFIIRLLDKWYLNEQSVLCLIKDGPRQPNVWSFDCLINDILNEQNI